MTIPAKQQQPLSASSVEQVLVRGNLAELREEQRLEYYNSLCKSLGLNPLTRPFEYLTLNNKLVLYARRDAADQLRKINGVNVEIISQDIANGLLTVHVRAKDKDGRTDEDLGVVAFGETLRGEAAANTIMKAVTKAKRRVTLSICGLGFLDETEVEDISAEVKKEPEAAPPQPKLGKARVESGTEASKLREKWKGFALDLLDSMKRYESIDDKRRIVAELSQDLMEMEAEAPDIYDRLNDRINAELVE